MPEDWIVPENRALARRPQVIGLPLGYAAMLIMATLFLSLTLHYYAAAVWLFAFGWSVGKLVVFYDPFGWEILAKSVKIPPIIRS